MANDDYFRQLRQGLSTDWQHVGDATAESKAVSVFLKGLGLTRFKEELRELTKPVEGYRPLSFEVFMHLFPTFPYHVAFNRIKGAKEKSTVGQMFSNFARIPIIKAFDLTFAEEEDRPCALVFPMQGVKQGLVVHNGPVPIAVPEHLGQEDKGSFCWLYVESGRTLVVERVWSFLHRLEATEEWL